MESTGVAVATLIARGVHRSFSAQADPPVLVGIDLEILPGATVAIMGPSGSGKTTLLQILGLLDRPDQGSIFIQGQDTTHLDGSQTAAVRSRVIGFLFQDARLMHSLTLLENVLVPTLAPGAPFTASESADRGRELLARTGLESRADRYPSQLSGGERQRGALARALIHRPALLLADEPTGALDERTAAALMDLVLDLRSREGTALVIATHSTAVARRLERVTHLVRGQLSAVP